MPTTILKDLGIRNLDEIQRVRVEHTETADTIIIYFGRTFFGLSSKRKKMKFNRPSREIFLDRHGRKEWKLFSCPSPQFQRVLEELNAA